MSKDNWINESVPIKDLFLWNENARFPDKYFNKDERELIEYFCSKTGFKIIELAKSIVDDFSLPQLEKFVVWDNDGIYVTLEGNRRLVAYKLLSNPALINNKALKKKFSELKLKMDIDDDFEVECLITEDIDQGFRYIERKHLSKNNEVSWGDNERAHHKSRIGKATQKEKFKVAMTNILKSLDIPEIMKDKILGPGYVTNLWRILESKPSRIKYGFKLDKKNRLKIKRKDFKKELKVIILNILEGEDFSGKKINSRSLNKNSEKEGYIKSITKKDHANAISKIKRYGKCEEEEPKSKPQKTSRRRKRDVLIPDSCEMDIEEEKLYNLYDELKRLNVKRFTNSVAVLLRVFIELSLDCFIDYNNIKTVNIDSSLKTKVIESANYLEKNKLADKHLCKGIRSEVNNKDGLLGIDTMNAYVHNPHFSPHPTNLITTWNNIQKFMEKVWKNIK